MQVVYCHLRLSMRLRCDSFTSLQTRIPITRWFNDISDSLEGCNAVKMPSVFHSSPPSYFGCRSLQGCLAHCCVYGKDVSCGQKEADGATINLRSLCIEVGCEAERCIVRRYRLLVNMSCWGFDSHNYGVLRASGLTKHVYCQGNGVDRYCKLCIVTLRLLEQLGLH